MPSVFGAFGKSKTVQKPTTEGWGPQDLLQHDISIRPVKPAQFFGHDPLTQSLKQLDPSLLATDISKLVSLVDTLPEQTFDILTYLTWASQAVPGEETALTDFLGEVLTLLGFVYPGASVKTQQRIPFPANTRSGGMADADLTITSSSGIIFLVAKTVAQTSTVDPEFQAIEAAIAAFHENNRILSTKLDMNELEDMEVPVITMVGTHITFYLVPVTKQLAIAPPSGPGVVKAVGKKPVVTKCQPLPMKGPGMEELRMRKTSIAYLNAFQGLAEGSCRKLRTGLNE